ncbi:DUF6249 domain-containing protein [Flavobacterium granuli]|uniref:DUF6249 domain-containing protein n=1 Tax=Flavobacterium granuli TaxID=280093 RepID=A0A1M5IUZ9_9FLAO|nr:DUF6249 domain-containing protein [Flavobacterium granuli]PRZ28122.1 hypothetical protein BC624_101409 [Flavobacterium granuli]SHG32168.1 hypothetical protein SAMN05443373_101409 [Flavobacterium granuli]
MGPDILALPVIFGAIFGVFYLFFSTRNKERLALIEKGADASIFMSKRQDAAPIWKVFILNLAVLLMGIGAGILLALIIQDLFGVTSEALFPGVIFLTAGTGLLVGFKMTKDLEKK